MTDETQKKFQAEFKELEKRLQETDAKFLEQKRDYEQANTELLRRERRYYRKLELLKQQFKLVTDPSGREALRGMEEDCDKTERELNEYRVTHMEKLQQAFELLLEVDSYKSKYNQIVFNAVVRERDTFKARAEGDKRENNITS